MPPTERDSWWSNYRWTLGSSVVLVLLNFDLCFGSSGLTSELAEALEFDGTAIRRGELRRVLTGNLVHWNAPHFYLDVGVFLVLGLIFEPSFRRAFPWLLLTTGLAAGLAGLVFWPSEMRCRGLSGVDSGLFAAAIFVEWRLAIRDPVRWLWVAPATSIFAVKNAYELANGRSFFSTEQLLGPANLAVAAHTAAILAALVFCALIDHEFRLERGTRSNQS